MILLIFLSEVPNISFEVERKVNVEESVPIRLLLPARERIVRLACWTWNARFVVGVDWCDVRVKTCIVAMVAVHAFFDFVGFLGAFAFFGYSTISRPKTSRIHFFLRMKSLVLTPLKS